MSLPKRSDFVTTLQRLVYLPGKAKEIETPVSIGQGERIKETSGRGIGNVSDEEGAFGKLVQEPGVKSAKHGVSFFGLCPEFWYILIGPQQSASRARMYSTWFNKIWIQCLLTSY